MLRNSHEISTYTYGHLISIPFVKKSWLYYFLFCNFRNTSWSSHTWWYIATNSIAFFRFVSRFPTFCSQKLAPSNSTCVIRRTNFTTAFVFCTHFQRQLQVYALFPMQLCTITRNFIRLAHDVTLIHDTITLAKASRLFTLNILIKQATSVCLWTSIITYRSRVITVLLYWAISARMADNATSALGWD